MIKVFFSTILLAVSLMVSAQGNSGLGFNYQAVVRGADGFVLSMQSVELRFSLMPGQHATEPSWVETHSVSTDAFGTVGVTVGKGTKAGGIAAEFEDVNFAAVYYWMKVEIKREGLDFRELGFTALPSVPYAEAASFATTVTNKEEVTYAETAAHAEKADFAQSAAFAETANKAESATNATNAVHATHAANGVPPGTIMAFAGDANKVPNGWMLCDGRQLNRTDYPALFDAISTAWGGYDNYFFLPDMRGMFLRGVSGNAIRDEDRNSRVALNTGGNSGNNVGSYQEDAIRNIKGQSRFYAHSNAVTYSEEEDNGAIYLLEPQYNALPSGSGQQDRNYYSFRFDASRNVPTGSDNRPQNVYVNYIIKY